MDALQRGASETRLVQLRRYSAAWLLSVSDAVLAGAPGSRGPSDPIRGLHRRRRGVRRPRRYPILPPEGVDGAEGGEGAAGRPTPVREQPAASLGRIPAGSTLTLSSRTPAGRVVGASRAARGGRRGRRAGGEPKRGDPRQTAGRDEKNGGPRCCDSATCVNGRKRHIPVETTGVLLVGGATRRTSRRASERRWCWGGRWCASPGRG